MTTRELAHLTSLLSALPFQARIHINAALQTADEVERVEVLEQATAIAPLAVTDLVEAMAETGELYWTSQVGESDDDADEADTEEV
jgi:hypothetical protein